MKDEIEFTINCKMQARWVPHFLSMLKYMEHLGNIGASREVTIYSDGDGDFRPKFEWNEELPSDANPSTDIAGDHWYDAG